MDAQANNRVKPGSMAARGFSMIEVLVAMVILVIIVLMVSALFHQSSIAWDAGMRKAEGNMMARAALGIMRRELEGAVDEGALRSADDRDGVLPNISAGGSSITFVRLTGSRGFAEGGRVAERVSYSLSGDAVIRNVKKCTDYEGTSATFEDMDDGGGETELITGVSALTFEWWPNATLRRGIRIKLDLKRSSSVSGVSAKSAGPDRKWGTNDDIEM